MADVVETVKNWPTKKKVTLLLVLALSIATLILTFAWSQRPEYHVLYSNLAETDAGSVVQKLREMKVPYELSGGGILVPADRVYDLRLQLAAQGLPQGGVVGFELFDKTDFGTTDFVQKLNYRRALQGELARTIMSLSEVEAARVHLAIPERTLFMREESRPSASVLVKLKPGRTLTRRQVQGIVHLVSSSVEGLNPEEVTIVDQRGEMLTQRGDDAIGLSSSQLEYQRSYEKDMESRILNILEPVVGKGKVRAKVAATIDFTRSEKTEERFDPEGQVIISEQRNIEKSTASGPGGVPGVVSNLPGNIASQVASSSAQSQKKNEVINYEVSKITSHVVSAVGQVKKLSVAVLVDGTYTVDEATGERKYTPRSEEELKHYEELVKRAIGFTEERGDKIRIANMPFETIPEVEELPEESKEYLPIVVTVAKYLVPVIAVILFFLFVLRPLMKSLSTPPVVQQVPELPQPVPELESVEPKVAGVKGKVIEWVENNPNQAADLIKSWIEEKKR
jgi:flagellar M-ring protein FliF